MKTKKYTSVEQYLADIESPVREKLEQLRDAIKQAAPKATEVISYNMPAYKMNRVLVYFAPAKAHLGFYPTPGALRKFSDALAAYETSKGAIRFPWEKPIPLALVKKIVRFRVKEDQELALSTRAKK
jgi:uncharacterized protein YdhG (YjbR/CyaY superfamily)